MRRHAPVPLCGPFLLSALCPVVNGARWPSSKQAKGQQKSQSHDGLKCPPWRKTYEKLCNFFTFPCHTHTHLHAHAHTHAQAESEVACLMHDFAFFVVRSDQRVRTKASWSWLVVSAPVQFLWLAVGNYGNCLVCLAKGCVQIDGEFMSALWIFKLTNGKIKLRDYQV